MTPSLSPQADAFLVDYFQREVLPLLTPVALDPCHPFPPLSEDSFHLAVRFRRTPGFHFRYGLVLVHSTLPRVLKVPDGPSEKSVVILQNELAIQHAKKSGLERVIWLAEGTATQSPRQQAFIAQDAGFLPLDAAEVAAEFAKLQ